jgi:four helix bundle protein
MATLNSYRDLIVWQKAMKLASVTYGLARLMPKQEEYRLTSQMLRAVASAPANIAEGRMRGSRRDYARFVNIARGSLAELETFLLLCIDVELLQSEQVTPALDLADEVGRMLNRLRARLEGAVETPSADLSSSQP